MDAIKKGSDIMNVKNLYPEQFEELRWNLIMSGTLDDIDHLLGNVDEWTDEEVEKWYNGEVTDEMVIKTFAPYDFVCDDFGCTAGQYDKYPDRKEN